MMTMTTTTSGDYLRSGALAGAAAAVAFSIVHHVMISDIWYSLPMMVAAGALCGLGLAWTYELLFEVRSISSFLGYNSIFLAMFVLLGVMSVIVYEPVETMAALIEANEPPVELIGRAMPMTVAFTLATAALFGRSRRQFGAILLTCTVLISLLVLNVSVIGLVAIPSGSLYVIGELLGLIAALNVAFVVSLLVLERQSFLGRRAIHRTIGRSVPVSTAD